MKRNILIVGGGPAGATAARLLAHEGRDVLLIEKDLSHRKPCGGGIPSGGLDDLGLNLDIPHWKVKEIKVFFPSGRNLRIPLRGGEIDIVERPLFDRTLRDMAEKEGAEVKEGMFLNLHEDGGEVISTVKIDGEVREIRSDYLIAADGVNSRVRQALGLGRGKTVYTYSSRLEGRQASACEFWFGNIHAPKFYSWVFPKGNALSIGTGSENPKEAKKAFERFLRRAGFSPVNVKKARGYMIPQWEDGPYRLGNVFFVGDAAGQVMPFTYEGIYYAMKGAEFLSEAIIENRPGLYRKLWRKRFYGRFNLMRRLETVFLRNDEQMERLFSIFSRKEVQEISMRLWLKKDADRGSLLSYLNIFRKYLR